MEADQHRPESQRRCHDGTASSTPRELVQTQALWVCAVIMTACGPVAGAEPPTPLVKSEPTGRGLADDKAVAAFYQPDEVQSVHLHVADAGLKRMLAALPQLVDVPASFRWRDATVENVSVRF